MITGCSNSRQTRASVGHTLACDNNMDILPPHEVYVDEANTPVFESKPRLNLPYVVCAIAVPVSEKKRIELLLPRDTRGFPIKASSQAMTDGLAAQFIEKVLRFDVLLSLVGLNSSDEESCKIATALTERANKNRSRRIRKPNLMYARVAAQAIINLCGFDKLSFFDLIFDSNSVPEDEFVLFENILKDSFGRRGEPNNTPLCCMPRISLRGLEKGNQPMRMYLSLGTE
jgi:hypothetical protein